VLAGGGRVRLVERAGRDYEQWASTDGSLPCDTMLGCYLKAPGGDDSRALRFERWESDGHTPTETSARGKAQQGQTGAAAGLAGGDASDAGAWWKSGAPCVGKRCE